MTHEMTQQLSQWLNWPGSERNIPFVLMAGPCAIEDEETPFEVAETVLAFCQSHHIPYIFKGSYRKANRSSGNSFKGIGDQKALEILGRIRAKYNVPVVTDIHESHEAEMAASYVDVLQIPAFLCRQTDLIEAAARTGKIVNIKKGQFMSGESMAFAADKVRQMGNPKVALTERGNSFGYQDLVVDFRNIPIMQEQGKCPVILDVTHALQKPNQSSGVTGGQPALIRLIASAGAAVGVNGFFIETHPEPARAKSDASNMLPLKQLPELLETLIRIHQAL
jgi:2-dehydro-3-deoxyphosphooctonate aldolase (KDO 8-P synthase)